MHGNQNVAYLLTFIHVLALKFTFQTCQKMQNIQISQSFFGIDLFWMHLKTNFISQFIFITLEKKVMKIKILIRLKLKQITILPEKKIVDNF